jgi:hypothetical protein
VTAAIPRGTGCDFGGVIGTGPSVAVKRAALNLLRQPCADLILRSQGPQIVAAIRARRGCGPGQN